MAKKLSFSVCVKLENFDISYCDSSSHIRVTEQKLRQTEIRDNHNIIHFISDLDKCRKKITLTFHSSF